MEDLIIAVVMLFKQLQSCHCQMFDLIPLSYQEHCFILSMQGNCMV